MEESACGRWMKRVPVLLLLITVAMIACDARFGAAWAEEEDGKPGYVRPIDSGPSLAEMEKGAGWSYNTDYIYVLTRGVRDSNMPAGAKVIVFVPAFVVDTAFLPVALIFGLFGD